MTNNAQLLPLTEDREEFEMFLIRHLGPGALAGDKISIYDAAELAFAKGIEHGRNALACIEAAQPIGDAQKARQEALDWSGETIEAAGDADEICNYPDCKCPTDNPCLKGLPADALGSLPVVAEVSGNGGWHIKPIAPELHIGMKLADHAQATAEIAKRDAEIKNLNFYLELQGSGFKSLAERNAALFERILELQAKLAGVDGLVNVLRAIIDNGPFTTGQKALLNAGSAALATYEAAQGTK